MRSPVFWRRSSAAVGVYVSALLGFLGTVVAVRELGIYAFGLLSLVLAATGFFQLLADLTVEEAVVKYGFGYAAREDWGRFRRVFDVGLRLKLAGGAIGACAIAVLAALSGAIWTHALTRPMLLAALLPLAQAPEGVASAALIVRKRYDLRAAFLVVSMALRLAALALGARFGVVETVLALVVAQVVATGAIGAAALNALGRFPRAEPEPLGPDGPGFRRFVVRSSLGSLLSPMRGLLGTLLLGIVAGPRQVAYFRVAQAPESVFASLTAPVRMILLAEQTAEVEQGGHERVYRTIRRYMVGAAAVVIVLLPPLVVLMPKLIRFVYGPGAARAVDAARLFLLVAGIQVVWGWAKSFAVSIGRPELRLVAQGAEVAVLVPALLALGAAYGATGAAAAFVIAAVAFAAIWLVLLARLQGEGAVEAAAGAKTAELARSALK